ncbi:hypothetical protein M422DRAFT_148577, partial [Sphaerobolus stellatus SS14]
ILGPIAGAWMAQESNWRWVFYNMSIICGVIQINRFIFLRESKQYSSLSFILILSMFRISLYTYAVRKSCHKEAKRDGFRSE